jgi:hypothetical protein
MVLPGPRRPEPDYLRSEDGGVITSLVHAQRAKLG